MIKVLKNSEGKVLLSQGKAIVAKEGGSKGTIIVAELGDSSLQVGDRVMVTNLALGNYNLNIADSVLKDNGIVTGVGSNYINGTIVYPNDVETVDFYIRAKITGKVGSAGSNNYQIVTNNGNNVWGLNNYKYPEMSVGYMDYHNANNNIGAKPNVWVWFKISQVNDANPKPYYMDDAGYSLEEVMSKTDWIAMSWSSFNKIFSKGTNYIQFVQWYGDTNYYDLSAMAFVVNGELVWRGCEVSHDKFTAFPLDNYRGEIFSTGVIESFNEDGTANVQVVEVPAEEVTLSTVDSEDYYSNLKLVVGGKDE